MPISLIKIKKMSGRLQVTKTMMNYSPTGTSSPRAASSRWRESFSDFFFRFNEGWLYEKNKKFIKLFASYDKDDDGITFGDRTMIPTPWVTKITKLYGAEHVITRCYQRHCKRYDREQ